MSTVTNNPASLNDHRIGGKPPTREFRGDHSALYRAYYPEAVKWVSRRGVADVDAVVDDAMLRSLNASKGHLPFRPLLYTHLRWASSTAYKKEAPRRSSTIELTDDLDLPDRSGEGQENRVEMVECVEQLLKGLSPLNAQLLRWRYWDDRSSEEIVQQLNRQRATPVSVAAVKCRLARLLSHLRRRLSHFPDAQSFVTHFAPAEHGRSRKTSSPRNAKSAILRPPPKVD